MRTTLLFVFLLSCMIASAQKKEKIRGDKNVTLDERTFGYFTKLEVNDNIKLILKQSKATKLVIEADENLQDVIDSDFENGALVLSLNKRIVSSKRFILTLFVDDLDFIELNDNSELKGAEKFSFFDLEMILKDKSEIEIELESQIFSLESNERSRGSITVKADSVTVVSKESSRLKSNINADKLVVHYKDDSAVEFVGKVTNLLLLADDNASYKGVELNAMNAILNANNQSNTFVNAKNGLEISAKNKSKIYIFNSPLITIKAFEDSASLYKRESMTLLQKL